MRKEITISGVIGEDYTILDLIEDTQGNYEGYDIIVDSAGGLVSTGYAIADFIAALPNTKTIAKRVYSIATVIFLAGKDRIVNDNSVFMIHNPYGIDIEGDKSTLRQFADSLEETEEELENFYSNKTGINKEVLSQLMEEETYFNADKALSLGFATAKEDVQELSYSNQFKAVAFLREVNQTYNDYPQEATENARKAIKFKESHPDMDCGTRVGWVRASQLAGRKNISIDTVSRIASFARFERFKTDEYVNKDGQYNCGSIMYDAWGGDAAIKWAHNKLDEVKNNFSNKYTNMNLIESMENLIGKFKNQSGKALAEGHTEEKKEEIAGNKEEVVEEKNEDDMKEMEDRIVQRVLEALKSSTSMQEEALSLVNKATERQNAATDKVIALAAKIETTFDVDKTKVFASSQEKEAELSPKEYGLKRARERRAKKATA